MGRQLPAEVFRTKKTCPFSSYFFSQILWLRLWTPFPYLCKRDLGNGHPLIVLSLSSPQATCASMKWTNLKKKIIASSVCQGPPRSIWVWLWPSCNDVAGKVFLPPSSIWVRPSWGVIAATVTKTFQHPHLCHSRSSLLLSFEVECNIEFLSFFWQFENEWGNTKRCRHP